MQRFISTFDLHYGFERKAGHKVALHDPKAWGAVMEFAKDFKPHVWIHGGDMLDCGAISHHNKNKPGRTEGLRLLNDATDGSAMFIKPVEALVGPEGSLVYLTGNHEDWLNDIIEDMPSLEGLVSLTELLGLANWKVIEQGSYYNLGKLTFTHGDNLSGGEHIAKAAVLAYDRNIRFGHHHTFQAYTKTSALNYKNAKTGICVPCLCTKAPKYGEGKPNKWVQGFAYGYVGEGGLFNDYIVTIIEGKFTANGKVYKG